MKRTVFLLLLVLLIPSLALGFGKNKVQYRLFDWKILASRYFDVYYYQDEEELARRVAVIADASYDSLSSHLDHELGRRTPIIVYGSHSEFQQTNVTLELLEEGTEGFTEIFKNRVVVHFNGSYEDLRHLVFHELTHVFTFDMIYGGLLESIFTRQYLFQLPLWFLEGIPEYESSAWDTEAEMVMRDAAISGYYFPLYYDVYGYLAYKQGQSVIKYVADKYGPEKIPDILKSLAVTRNIDDALMNTIGTDTQGLTESWSEYLRERYWPDISSKDDPDDVAQRLTDHRRDGSFVNGMPAISPDGQKIVYISDKSGYFDIRLMSAIDGRQIRRLVKGQRSQDFESFHSLRSSFGWSPDGERIAFVSKRRDRDVLYLMDAPRGKKLRRFEPDFDTIYYPCWSADGRAVAFVGQRRGAAGIYSVDVESGEVEEIHTGALEYSAISFSPDGTKLAFSAIAPGCVDSLCEISRVGPYAKPTRDIYVLNVDRGVTERVTYCPSEDMYPVWSPDGEKLMFVSDRDGTYNLFIYDFDDSTSAQITNVLGGVFTPSWSREGNRIAFTCFNEAGWDVFQVKNPMENLGVFRVQKEQDWEWEAPWLEDRGLSVFAPPEIEVAPGIVDSSVIQQAMEYETRPYKIRFTPDWVGGAFQYSSAYGLGGYTQLSVSDVLGNHRISIATEFFSSFKETDFLGIYNYLKRRTNYGFGVFHFKNYYYASRSTMGIPIGEGRVDRFFSERNYGGLVALSYPLDKFRRFDLEFTAQRIDREVYEEGSEYLAEPVVASRRQDDVYSVRVSYVKDNTIWGHMGPVGGTRYFLSFDKSIVDILGSDLNYNTGYVDFRKYFRLTPSTQLAFRLSAASSQGAQPTIFYLGGGYTLRGYPDFEFEGNNMALASLELRYPFIDRLVTRGPIPLALGGIRGVFFFDIGGAWHGQFNDIRVARMEDGTERLDDLHAAYGFGFRMIFSYLLVRLDFAWATDFGGPAMKRVHFTLGGDF
jgi:Tol biopolymer transport system component